MMVKQIYYPDNLLQVRKIMEVLDKEIWNKQYQKVKVFLQHLETKQVLIHRIQNGIIVKNVIMIKYIKIL